MVSGCVGTVRVVEVSPARIVTVCAPSSLAATKSLPGASATSSVTARSLAGATGSAVTVNVAAVPSVTAGPGAMRMFGARDAPSRTVTVKRLRVGCGSAPSGTLVPRSRCSKPFGSVLLSGPSATVKVSVPPSPRPSSTASSTSVATLAPAPAKRSRGVAVSSRVSVTPALRSVPAARARRQSAVVTPVPETASGTSTTSPATRERVRVTVSPTVAPSVTVARPVRASETTVGSTPRMMSGGSATPSRVTHDGRRA